MTHGKHEKTIIEKNHYIIRVVICLIVLLIPFITKNSYAKYTKNISSRDSVGTVAKFGTLNLYEYTVEDNSLIDSNMANFNENINVNDGQNISKKVEISYTKGEVSAYIFLAVEAMDWTYTQGTKTLSVKGTNNVDLIYWKLNDNWTYFSTEELNSAKRYIFYHLVREGEEFYDTVLDQIRVNPISVEDKDILNNDHSIKFNAYAIQKNGMDNVEMAWNYAKTEE